MADYHKYRVWRRAHRLSVSIHRITRSFPADERYDLTRQVRRAARSISANLAEGLGRHGDRTRAYFTDVALGSAYELECHLTLARSLRYIDNATFAAAADEISVVRRMLSGLRRCLTEH